MRLLGEFEHNSRAKLNVNFAPSTQDNAFWMEGSLGQQKDKHDLLLGYSFARIEQDAVISQFNESDLRAATNVLQHRIYANWLVQKNVTAAFTAWVGRTLNSNLQNASLAPGFAKNPVTGLFAEDPLLKRLQFDLIYKF